MNKKVILAFGISVFAGFGYLGYLNQKRRTITGLIQKNLDNSTGIEKEDTTQ